MIVLALLISLCGLWMLIHPASIWALTEQWKSSDASEPSSLYLWSTRVGGLICMVVGLVTLLVALS